MSEEQVTIADRYELGEVIARGGMATVFRAQDLVLARPVALKVLHPHLAQDEAFLERFRREALAAAGLTHPHIVSTYDTGEEDGPQGPRHYIVMEHCGGGTLGDLLAREGPFATERVVEVGTTVCDALGYAHSKGIVHRDVKPANILVGDDSLLKIGDFGIAKAAASNDITTTGAIIGTVAYISPEYARDRELDARSDLYSLGVVLYELAAGRPPFGEASDVATALKHVNTPPPPLRSVRAGIARPLEAVVMRALEKDPELRFASAAEMRAALLQVTGGRAPASTMTMQAPPRAQPAPATFSSESRWIVPVLGLIVAAIALVAIAYAVFDTDDRRENARGDRSQVENGSGAVEVREVSDFDPHGGGEGEHPDEVGFAIDGDTGSTWGTESYDTALSVQKPGVGLLFDLGSSVEIDRVQVQADDDLTLVLLAGDEPPGSEEDLEEIGAFEGSPYSIEAGAQARYWLVWITALPGDGGGSARIAEVKFFGP